jgi:hypothetical protein
VRVVITGARNRNEMKDTALVNAIIDDCKERISNLIIVVASCDKGVGRIVRSRNLDKHLKNTFEFDMIELQMRHFLQQELPRPEFTQHWNALNAVLLELGDEFHLLTEEFPKGAVYDLLRRVKEAHRPYAVYKPSENTGPKKCEFDSKEIVEVKEVKAEEKS